MSASAFDRMLLRDAKLGVQNHTELGDAEDQLRDATNSLTSDDVPLPDGFPAPRLALPQNAFAPDYFAFGVYDFCSHRLRVALAQPAAIVQFAPVDLVLGGEEARG